MKIEVTMFKGMPSRISSNEPLSLTGKAAIMQAYQLSSNCKITDSVPSKNGAGYVAFVNQPDILEINN